MIKASGLQAWILFVMLGVGFSQEAAAAEGKKVPSFTVTGGLGHATGWLGVQGEHYVKNGRASVFAGLGYVYSETFSGLETPTGLGLAVGGRLYSRGLKHRAYVEASLCELATEVWTTSDGQVEQAHRYGPGVQVGYQFLASRGFTATTSVGVGYAIESESDHVTVMMGIAVGYTGRRAAK